MLVEAACAPHFGNIAISCTSIHNPTDPADSDAAPFKVALRLSDYIISYYVEVVNTK